MKCTVLLASLLMSVIASHLAASELDTLCLLPKVSRAAASRLDPLLVRIQCHDMRSDITGADRRVTGTGTGFFITENLIMTSTFHLAREPKLIVIEYDKRNVPATVWARDTVRKVALLKPAERLRPADAPALTLAAQPAAVGTWVLALGKALDAGPATFSRGIMSAHGRFAGIAVQTDAKLSPINYGGPLIDLSGQVHGICVPLSPSSDAVGAGIEWYDSGIGFAIPLDHKQPWLKDLFAGRNRETAYLGLTFSQGKQGLIVTEVLADSPAQHADIKVGDVLSAMADMVTANSYAWRCQLARHAAGDTIAVTIKRDGQSIVKNVIASRPPDPENNQ